MVFYRFRKNGIAVPLDTVEYEYINALGEVPEYKVMRSDGDRAMQFEELCYSGILCTKDGYFDAKKFAELYMVSTYIRRATARDFLFGTYVFESWVSG